jgi:hypothetical protein
MTWQNNPQRRLSVFLYYPELHANAVADDNVLMSVGVFSAWDSPVFFRMKRIETQLILNQVEDEDSASDPQREAKDID